MAADRRFELVLRDALHRRLDAAQGPDPRWADSPAAARVAESHPADVRPRWRSRPSVYLAAALTALLAVAGALLAGGVGRSPVPPPQPRPTVLSIVPTARPLPTASATTAAVEEPAATPRVECPYLEQKDVLALWPQAKLTQQGCTWSGGIRTEAFGIEVHVVPTSDGGAEQAYHDALLAASPEAVRQVSGLGDKAFIARGFKGKGEGSIFRCCDNAANDHAEDAVIHVRSGWVYVEIRTWDVGLGGSGPWSAKDPAAKFLPRDAALIRAARLVLRRTS
jgi:hypothetical protein